MNVCNINLLTFIERAIGKHAQRSFSEMSKPNGFYLYNYNFLIIGNVPWQ
jgi:hypothetical protein